MPGCCTRSRQDRFCCGFTPQPSRRGSCCLSGSLPWCACARSPCTALAIYFRKRPEYHRRLVFVGRCQLAQASFVRFHYIGYHDLFYPALDLLIIAGILRDLVVDGRVNKLYVYVFSAIIVLQTLATYLERVSPSWWRA